MVGPADVLTFWFGPDGPQGPIPDENAERWWRKSDAFDAEIRRRFGEIHDKACAGELDAWRETPRGLLALVIVLDQFSRNLHRNDPRAWALDGVAQKHCLAALEAGTDRQLPPHGRLFLYMPLMHAEDRDLQQRSVEQFTELASEAPEFERNLKYADQHKLIVDRFGRFPHRNAALGRDTTAQEAAFLKQPGSSF